MAGRRLASSLVDKFHGCDVGAKDVAKGPGTIDEIYVGTGYLVYPPFNGTCVYQGPDLT